LISVKSNKTAISEFKKQLEKNRLFAYRAAIICDCKSTAFPIVKKDFSIAEPKLVDYYSIEEHMVATDPEKLSVLPPILEYFCLDCGKHIFTDTLKRNIFFKRIFWVQKEVAKIESELFNPANLVYYMRIMVTTFRSSINLLEGKSLPDFPSLHPFNYALFNTKRIIVSLMLQFLPSNFFDPLKNDPMLELYKVALLCAAPDIRPEIIVEFLEGFMEGLECL
jgi:hypothetical protein